MSDSRQSTLDEYIERLARPTPPVTTQDRELRRVRGAIGNAIVAFCRAHLRQAFRATELRAYVEAQCGPTAPGSSDRILRALRRDGVVAYQVLNRAQSLYLVTEVAP